MRVKVLGSAAGGGFPQWNCGCSNCSRLRRSLFKGRARTQAQLAVSLSPSHWLLLNASPDLRQQILSDPELAPADGARGSPIASIVLTSADADCVLGLLHLREFQPLRIYATPGVRRILSEENSLFKTLERSVPPVQWENLVLNRPLPISGSAISGGEAGLCCRAVPLHGEFPDYVSSRLRNELPPDEAVIGLELTQQSKKLFYAPTLPPRSEEWKQRLRDSQLALIDGTFWTDNELIGVRGAGKTAREIGHVPLSGSGGLLEEARGVGTGRRVLIHLNNTNPALDEESPAYAALRDAGWEVAYDGMEFEL
ncbi:MAG TPA: pyrroloquinoline quinone biosynthesis protein PqqB [Candidatus Bathyarchaeia archaeon]|nr:pyrroloquinoline quinone biosynthesis protein PqqB [Candidatus Bathyarchaeia archaeon]